MEVDHERWMGEAIHEGRKNPRAPFGAVIVDVSKSEVIARGVNRAAENPLFHGETAAIDAWAESGKPGDPQNLILYTTAEPCPMCTAAVVWSRIGSIVWGISVEDLTELGWDQFEDGCKAGISRAPFVEIEVLGGVLRSECLELFESAGQKKG